MPVHTSREVSLDSPERLKAIADDTRAKILRVLQDGPASAKELSELLEMSHGRIGHHVKVLREAGLIEVVDERPVRAVIERFYGLAFDRLSFDVEAVDRLRFTLHQAAREAAPGADQPLQPAARFLTARISDADASDFHRRLGELADEFVARNAPTAGRVYGLLGAIFVTDTPAR